MSTIFVTREVPEEGLIALRNAGHVVDVSPKDGVLTKEELIAALSAKPYDAVLCLLTDKIDGEVMDAVPSAKIFANYAVGFDNIDVAAAKERGVIVTNTPDVLSDTVALHALALILALARRIPESDRFVRAGKYKGWQPLLLLGMDLTGKTLGIVGAGRIGQSLARMAHNGFGMHIVYTDMKRNEAFEAELGASFVATIDELLPQVDALSLHVPLLPTTTHLMNAARLSLMKKSAYLVNTSRGPVVDEVALVEALRTGVIAGAALDVFEHEPALSPGLTDLENVILTPHTASASRETRAHMAEVAAKNILTVLGGEGAPNAL